MPATGRHNYLRGMHSCGHGFIRRARHIPVVLQRSTHHPRTILQHTTSIANACVDPTVLQALTYAPIASS
jgi:hypothetical protein